MINCVDVAKENKKEANPNWPLVSDHPYRILQIRASESGKTNSFFNLISLNKIFMETCQMKKIYMRQKIYYQLTKGKLNPKIFK